jgi:type IV pilus assembly protein PilX
MATQCLPNKQKGVVLVIGLIMLVLLTLLGITGAQNALFEEKMASNVRDKNMAFEAAEAALIAGENYIQKNVISTGPFDSDGSDGLYNNAIENIWQKVDWTGNDTGNSNEVIVYVDLNSAHKIKTSPKYVIQHYGTIVSEEDKLNLDNYGQGTGAGEVEMFRVTARGTGGSNDATVVLQTTYGKRL